MKKLLILSILLLTGCMEETFTTVIIPKHHEVNDTMHSHPATIRGELYIDDIIR
jgi:hypothetical protein